MPQTTQQRARPKHERQVLSATQPMHGHASMVQRYGMPDPIQGPCAALDCGTEICCPCRTRASGITPGLGEPQPASGAASRVPSHAPAQRWPSMSLFSYAASQPAADSGQSMSAQSQSQGPGASPGAASNGLDSSGTGMWAGGVRPPPLLGVKPVAQPGTPFLSMELAAVQEGSDR